MRVVLTRPHEEAVRWAQELRVRGHDVVQLPLIAVEPVPDPHPLSRAWASLDGFAAVMFVSANAVRHFFAAGRGGRWPAATRAWATGPGTAAALQEAGVPPARVDAPPPDAAQFDSETLWAQVRSQLHGGATVLVVRGGDAQGRPAGRDWLAQQLQACGVRTETVVAYRRAVPAWQGTERSQAAQAARDGSVWLFSSSEAVANLARLMPDLDWSGARAVATHERIAQAARECGFPVVWLSRPAVDDVAGTLESIR